MAMLGAHLHHGIWSPLQTLGLTNSARARAPRQARRPGRSPWSSPVGFSLVPIFVLAGVIAK